MSVYTEAYLAWFRAAKDDPKALTAAVRHCAASLGISRAARLLDASGLAQLHLRNQGVKVE